MSTDSNGNRFLSLVLTGTGLIALCVSIYVSARVGWSLADATADRTATAIILGLADFAAAMLVLAGAIMWKSGRRWHSLAALAFAGLFLFVGYLSAYGFFSGRIAVHASQKAAVKVDAEYLKWLQGQTVNMDVPRWQRLKMLEEAKAANREMKVTASIVSDRYALPVAALFGWTLEQAQTRITVTIALAAYAIKFSCLWLGPMVYPGRRREKTEPDRQSGSGSGGSGEPASSKVVRIEPAKAGGIRAKFGGSPPKVSNVGSRVSTDAPARRLTFQQFVETISHDMADGEPASSTRALAKATGWSQTSVVRAQRKVKGKGKAFQNVRRYPGNGGGFHVSAMG